MRLDIPRWTFLAGIAASLVLGTARPSTAQTDPCPETTFHLSRSPANQLLLSTAAPTAETAQFADSPVLSRAGGNPWREIGEWEGQPPTGGCDLSDLGDLAVWLGLRNSDDQGTSFDLRAEVLYGGTIVAESERLCISGLTRAPARAAGMTLALPSAPRGLAPR